MRETRLEVTMVPVSELMPYENNAKIHTDRQIGHIAASIELYGFNDPIGIWHNAEGAPEIVTGHGALMAAKKLGMQEVPCTFLDHLSDEERRIYCHVHNQTQLETGFDVDSLIADMDNLNADWDNLGFSEYCYNADDFGTEFSLPEGDGPLFKTISLNLTREQFDMLSGILDAVDREQCSMRGGNENGDKVVEVARQWAGL